MSKILLVDDDTELTDLLAEVLSLSGFDVDVANNGQEALNKLNQDYSLIVLDVMMPILNGIETLKCIRQQSNVPVIMLTACGEEIDRVLGLELGADDYLPKPFNDRELIARIKAILRRIAISEDLENTKAKSEENGWIYFCELKLHSGYQQAFYKTQDLLLTASEFSLLEALIHSQGNLITREELSMNVLGKPLTPFDRSIDMHMSNLRKKLPPREDGLPWFRTLRGRGYLLISK
ncbi:response regulator [Rodentibacter pneumotropicus]|uniref:Response regulator n=1 Tax=Rodentibacter pneumotropicus TaxID=758 RepID=A0A4S2PBZ2_9PAST|nr:response regulator [Rodentibacter pneumotropicus]MDC2825756.1 response regulator [Rodentibacter pneumotropicus]THA00670.1 response regulator [Rodentibacter pneumotropicus]THA01841.1 response regulator [Rodentibacter pneumotropicus]THA07656.1 response regulator [Rodentibacter pneumotropicus]THA17435.1 response regulator [Rodentibacter pneumotropicus]